MKYIVVLLLILPCSVIGQVESDSAKVHRFLNQGGRAARTAAYDSARYYYQQAEALAREANYPHGIMSSTFGHGLVHHYEREIDIALEYYLLALEMTKDGIDLTHPDVILLYNNLGGAYIDLGYRLKAREYLEWALELKEFSEDFPPISTAITEYNIGLIYLYFGEKQSALHYFMSAYPVYLEHYGKNGSRLAQLYTNVGGIHRDLGNIEQAEEYFKRGIAIHLKNHGPTYWNLAYPYTNLGSLYMQTDQRQLGLEYYLKSLDLCKKDPKQLIRLEALNEGALAQYYLKESAYDVSRNHATAAVNIMQEAFYKEHPRISEFYQIIGQSYVKQGDFEEANQWFDKALDLTIQGYGPVHPQISSLHLEQSKMYLENENYQYALESAQQALITMSSTFESEDITSNPDRKEVLNEKLLIDILSQKGAVFQGLAKKENNRENLASALNQYQAATETIDYLRRGYLSESAKLYLQNNAVEVYQEAIEICYQLQQQSESGLYLDQAFYFMEKSKSSVLSEALQASNVTSIHGVDASILEKEVALNNQIRSFELKLADATIEESDSVQVSLKAALFHTRTGLDSLEDVIRATAPEYHQLKYNMEVATLKDAMASLSSQTMAISFFEADSSWYVLSFTSEDSDLKQVPKTDLSVKQLEDFRGAISNPESDPTEIYAIGNGIYEKLLKQSLDPYKTVDQLILVPDGILNYLPFAALNALDSKEGSSNSGPRFMLEDYAISYRNSITLYAQETADNRYDYSYIGFAPNYAGISSQIAMREALVPLAGARDEVEMAANMFSGLMFLDSTATEGTFKQLPYSTSILHLAMHATVDDQDPMKSRLIFTQNQDSTDDGSLNTYEIYQLPLKAELAVLSACNTGTGKINRGEGVLSISRAFMYAGCPNIVMSLWRASDQPSTEIMNTFFANLKNGLPKDQALRQAKLAYLKTADPFKAHPANWATFVLLGDPGPLSTPINPWLWMPIVGLALVLAALYYRKRKRKVKHQDSH